MKLQIEILNGKSEIKNITNKQGHQVGFKQEAYIHLPDSAYPVQFYFRTERPLQTGHYYLQPTLQINKYNDLEINPFAFPSVTPVQSKDTKAA